MEKKHRSGISTFSAQLTSTISVAMVLLILGIVAILSITARSITNDIKESMGMVIEISTDAHSDEINALEQSIKNAPYLSSYSFKSAEDILNEEKEHLGEEIMDVLDVNPYRSEFDIKVKPDYANRDSLEKIKSVFASNKSVATIHTNTEVVDSVNSGIDNLIIVLTIVAVALLIISFVLINNTVRLTIYSRRFIIHTMKLVGATAGFIRRPFVTNSIINGIIASIIAILLMSGIIYYLNSIGVQFISFIGYELIACVFVGLIIVGILICAIAATFATNKYLRSSYDEMFK